MDIAVWFTGEHGTGRMTGACHSINQRNEGPVCMLAELYAGECRAADIHRPASGGTLRWSHPEYLIR